MVGWEWDAGPLSQLVFPAGGDELQHVSDAVGESNVLLLRVAAMQVSFKGGVVDKLAAGAFVDLHGAQQVQAAVDEFRRG